MVTFNTFVRLWYDIHDYFLLALRVAVVAAFFGFAILVVLVEVLPVLLLVVLVVRKVPASDMDLRNKLIVYYFLNDSLFR
jgi:hypothetical protein